MGNGVMAIGPQPPRPSSTLPTASWAGSALGEILKSEAAQKTLRTVTETATKAAIASFVS